MSGTYHMTNSSTAEKPTAPTPPALTCCPDHAALLADLEHDATLDPDVAALMPRARYLLSGRVGPSREVVPWWAR